MRKKIPSSASLQAFDAAARHGNFARAAEELALTEGAISRQIARLESLLNCRLFDRTGSRVSGACQGSCRLSRFMRPVFPAPDSATLLPAGSSFAL
ncbi:LysR family transcriptional regulator, partial [Serratia ficaria]|uniref:LysR family transcriptional regulator n=1 Tax=Serratia ficaria TaxID=61651 RepID=UPI0021C9D786